MLLLVGELSGTAGAGGKLWALIPGTRRDLGEGSACGCSRRRGSEGFHLVLLVPSEPPGAEGSIFLAGRPTLVFLCCSFLALQESFDTPRS